MSISISWPSILNITTLDTGLPTLGETRVLHRYPAVCKKGVQKEKWIPFILLWLLDLKRTNFHDGQPGRYDKSEVIITSPPQRVQLGHDRVQTEKVVSAVLLRLERINIS